jgi:hypothetical protein
LDAKKWEVEIVLFCPYLCTKRSDRRPQEIRSGVKAFVLFVNFNFD